MGDTPSDGSNRPIGRSVPPGAMPAQPRPSAQRAHERRRALIVSCGMLLVAALAAVVVIAAESPMSRHASNPPPAAPAMPGSDLRTGKITRQSDGDGCWQQVFDNQTGRMRRSQQPCEATAYDGNGASVPIGTIHRLDAISKSFSGH
jgi:hypothetical protein